jgi:hypothetical protein
MTTSFAAAQSDSYFSRIFFWQSNGKVEKFTCNICPLHVLRESAILVSGRFNPPGLGSEPLMQDDCNRFHGKGATKSGAFLSDPTSNIQIGFQTFLLAVLDSLFLRALSQNELVS